MVNKVDTNSNNIISVYNDGTGENFDKLNFPSEHQYVILDTQTQKANQKFLKRLPITFKILYNGHAPDPPALTLLINPQMMNVSSSKKVNANLARGGHVIEEWGEMQDTLEFSGKIGAYYVLDPTIGFSGLNRYHRSKSSSFKNLMNLFMLYRNNGAIFKNTIRGDTQGVGNKLIQNKGLIKINNRIPIMANNANNRIFSLGDLFLLYDGTEYKGSFDNFSITENADSPYTLSYSFNFIVQSKRETDHRSLDYHTQTASRDVQDNSSTKFTGQQRKNLEKTVARNVASSARSAGIDRANLANAGQVFINPSSLSVPEDITGNNYPQRAAIDHAQFLKDEGLTVDSDDVGSLINNAEKISSDDFTTSKEGRNEAFNTHNFVLDKSGREANSETTLESLNLTTELERNVNEKKSYVLKRGK
ncbi:hypothetical protein N9948_01400 [bacterium]|nr:hypothetical protein [bacterium]